MSIKDALEITMIAHGLPRPLNLDIARVAAEIAVAFSEISP